jgi:hypothetical protein
MKQLLATVKNQYARNILIKVFIVSESHWTLIDSINKETTNGQLKGQIPFASESGEHSVRYEKHGNKYVLKETQLRELFGGLNAASRLILLIKIDRHETTVDEAVKTARKIKLIYGAHETISKYYRLAKSA